MAENEIARCVVDAAIDVHRNLGGPGLLESVYEEALGFELELRGMQIGRQILVPVIYKGHEVGAPLRLDLIVNQKVIIECKAAAQYNSLFDAQLLTYLRITNVKLGLVVNFGARFVKDGIRRVVNNLACDSGPHKESAA